MKIIKDNRGSAYKSNQIEITDKGYARYCSTISIEYFKKSKHPIFPSESIYTLFGIRGIELGDISLNDEDIKELDNLLQI